MLRKVRKKQEQTKNLSFTIHILSLTFLFVKYIIVIGYITLSYDDYREVFCQYEHNTDEICA